MRNILCYDKWWLTLAQPDVILRHMNTQFYSTDIDVGLACIITMVYAASSILDARSKAWLYGEPVADPEQVEVIYETVSNI